MEDGETGIFEEYLNRLGNVMVSWTWWDGDDWDADGYYDLTVKQDNIEITNDLTKAEYNYLLQCTKEHSQYEPPSFQRVGKSINAHFNKTF